MLKFFKKLFKKKAKGLKYSEDYSDIYTADIDNALSEQENSAFYKNRKHICKNGHEFMLKEAVIREYNSPQEMWTALCGRAGWHYHCPECDEIVKYFYHTMS